MLNPLVLVCALVAGYIVKRSTTDRLDEVLVRLNRLHRMGVENMAELDDRLTALETALQNQTDAVTAVDADLRATHQELITAIDALKNAGDNTPTPAQLARLDAITERFGALSGKLQQVVADTPDPNTPTPPTPPEPPVVG